eukprot:3842133-Rhodomonas_salina.1
MQELRFDFAAHPTRPQNSTLRACGAPYCTLSPLPSYCALLSPPPSYCCWACGAPYTAGAARTCEAQEQALEAALGACGAPYTASRT